MAISHAEDGEMESSLKKAAEVIRSGGIVAYPTETVYGLGADPFNKEAVMKVFSAKGRMTGRPLSVAVKDISQADLLAFVNDDARELAKTFLPGPLTIVLRKRPGTPDELTAGLGNIGIRIPDNPLALRFISLAGPVTATSANVSGMPSPTTAAQAIEQLGGKLDFVIDGGECKLKVESSIVDVSSGDGKFNIIRHGAIGEDEIGMVLSKRDKSVE